MNDSYDDPEDARDPLDDLDLLRDHLTDFAIREVFRDSSPPDLGESILARAKEPEEKKVDKQIGQNNRVIGIALASAICVAALASPWILQRVNEKSDRAVSLTATGHSDSRDSTVEPVSTEAISAEGMMTEESRIRERLATSGTQDGSQSSEVGDQGANGKMVGQDVSGVMEDSVGSAMMGSMGGGMMSGTNVQVLSSSPSSGALGDADAMSGGYGGNGDQGYGGDGYGAGYGGGYGGGGYGGGGYGGGGYGGGGGSGYGGGYSGGYGGMPEGMGRGDRPEEKTDTNFYASKVRSNVRKGRMVVTGNVRSRGGYGNPADQDLFESPDDLFARGGDRYGAISENPFIKAQGTQAVSTFSIDVDTASFTNARQMLLQLGQLPPSDSVRIEEFINYFAYDYETPAGDKPFAANIEVSGCPWQPGHRLVRIGLKGKEIRRDRRPSSNLVFLVDVSGSMDEPNKLPLVLEGLTQLTRELGENDRVAIVVYASQEGIALPSTRGNEKQRILNVLSDLRPSGSTAGGAGIQLAYKIAQENFVTDGTNRVILCTDGDFNVGVTDTNELERMAEEKAKTGVFLTVLGFGRGNLNDAMMERISNKGNGNYHYVDSAVEAHKVLVREMSGTLVTIAKDVKIQVEFNPARVESYRLIGYENRMLAREDFSDDTKDAGEIGAGHTVTALYQVAPVGGAKSNEPLKYQQTPVARSDTSGGSQELLELRIRYKEPDGVTSKLLKFPVVDSKAPFSEASNDFRFAAATAGFGMLLRNSPHRGSATYNSIQEMATQSASPDEYGYRTNLVEMIRRARSYSGK